MKKSLLMTVALMGQMILGIVVFFMSGLLPITGCSQREGPTSSEETPTYAGEQLLHKSGDGDNVATSPVALDLTSGTTGTIFFNQSFNGETRGVDVTVLGASNLNVISMTLKLMPYGNHSQVFFRS